MDFSNHPLNKQSTIDNRQSKTLKQSTIDIDYLAKEIRLLLNDETVGNALIAKAFKYLGEAQVRSIADYATRKAHTPGRAFVSICAKELNKKSL
jgi:hypothetical protein